MAGQSVSGFNELSTSTNSSDSTKRPGTPQITPSELSRPVNLQRIAQRKAQIKTHPIRKKLEKLGVYSSCKASMNGKKVTNACDGHSCWIKRVFFCFCFCFFNVICLNHLPIHRRKKDGGCTFYHILPCEPNTA